MKDTLTPLDLGLPPKETVAAASAPDPIEAPKGLGMLLAMARTGYQPFGGMKYENRAHAVKAITKRRAARLRAKAARKVNR